MTLTIGRTRADLERKLRRDHQENCWENRQLMGHIFLTGSRRIAADYSWRLIGQVSLATDSG